MPIISGSSTSTANFTKSGLAFGSDASVLYAFNNWTFTAAGASGRNGPSLSQVQSAYSSASWASNTSYLTVISGIQKWTVPKSGVYRIQAAGAPGGRGSDFASNQGIPGSGAILSASFYLNKNDIVYILVGQKGGDTTTSGNGTNGFNSDTDGGGGGGTFVALKVPSSQYYLTPDSSYVTPLIVAGGGNGGASDGNGLTATYTSISTAGTINDQWGYSTGGGWNSYPTDAITGISGLTARINYGLTTGDATNYGGGGANHPRPGSHFLAGGQGGVSCSNIGEAQAGFGGGGGATDEGGSGGGGWLGGVGSDGGTGTQATSFVSPNGTNVSYDGYNSWATATTPDGYCAVTYYG